MGKIQTRRSVSLSGATFQVLRDWCDAHHVAMSAALEGWVREKCADRDPIVTVHLDMVAPSVPIPRDTKPVVLHKPSAARHNHTADPTGPDALDRVREASPPASIPPLPPGPRFETVVEGHAKATEFKGAPRRKASEVIAPRKPSNVVSF